MNTRTAEKECIKEQQKQLQIMNCTCFTALYEMGYDVDQIIRWFNEATDIWMECRKNRASPFEVLENETGIELALEDEKSYKEFGQLLYHETYRTPQQYIYSLYRRKRWMAPLILATLLTALYRNNVDNIEEFISRTDEIRREHKERVNEYPKLMEERTGYTPKVWERQLWTMKFGELN